MRNYMNAYKINIDKIFWLIPNLVLVHRKNIGYELKDYEKQFYKNTGILINNLILLSEKFSFSYIQYILF